MKLAQRPQAARLNPIDPTRRDSGLLEQTDAAKPELAGRFASLSNDCSRPADPITFATLTRYNAPMTTPQEMRDANIAFLNQRGFKPAAWMPLPCAVGEPSGETGFAGGTLRPEIEIANRLLCHCGVFAWGSAPSEFEQRIVEFVANNDLRALMTKDELKVVHMSMDESSAQFAHMVGWRLENMWSLAWILGVADEPSAITGQLPEETSGALMSLFLPEFAVTAESLLAQGQTQPVERIVQVQDLFYLAHNAVRAGQTGHPDQLPDDFDPISDGGAIHERRHSLTWSLAPGAEWDETDLST